MFRPSVNTTLLQSHRQGALITILYKAFMSETRHMSKTTRHGRLQPAKASMGQEN